MTQTFNHPTPAHQWASDDVTAPHRGAWDLFIVGGGTAGLVAAKTAARFGASVLMVEKARTGGDCLWTGCVPSKTLLSAAHLAATARDAARFRVHGIIVDTGGTGDTGDTRGTVDRIDTVSTVDTGLAVRIDFDRVMESVREAVRTIEPEDSPTSIRATGARVAQGVAVFTGPRTATVNGRPVRFRHALIATGAAPAVPPIPGLAGADPLTSESIWSLTDFPARLLVLGGGSIGCELSQAFARLGSAVTVVEALPSLLAREDPDAAAIVTRALTEDGVTVRTRATLVRVSTDHARNRAELADGTSIEFDRVLVAVGRRPRVDKLGLDLAGVELTETGHIRIDDTLRTTNRAIWAAGDVTPLPPFTHTAGHAGSTAAANAVLGLRRSLNTGAVPRVTYTQPEVAAVGVGAADARGKRGMRVATVAHTDLDRAVAERCTSGFSRLVIDRKGRVVGACLVGPRAGESLAEVTLAVRQGLTARAVAASMHAYPTYSDGVGNAAVAEVNRRLRRPLPQLTIRGLRTLQRWFSR